ncbi:energy transducer TonB [Litorimonas sp.]|uniref:energy transducer TonB n=1 Tax=Litorimonas sp. TaxID=1892381 RepID=UPI003A8783B0
MRISDLVLGSLAAAVLSSCGSTSQPFEPASQYPPDPWVKGYSNPDDCLGGEKLAARNFEMPDYPSRPYRTGRQGWTIMRLDVDAAGQTQNVEVEKSVPDGMFDKASQKAVENWTFAPPAEGPLENCRVLLRYRAGSVTLGG